ncbi:unnamed protein product [Leptosia nina]|uniref:Uncharacterized protein n=1 Tax=Leptosia nina TaxID=320188 RepID=A0AAV1K144_9NEOP
MKSNAHNLKTNSTANTKELNKRAHDLRNLFASVRVTPQMRKSKSRSQSPGRLYTKGKTLGRRANSNIDEALDDNVNWSSPDRRERQYFHNKQRIFGVLKSAVVSPPLRIMTNEAEGPARGPLSPPNCNKRIHPSCVVQVISNDGLKTV